MLFNTLTFPLFLILSLFAFHLAPTRWRTYLLLVASYLFYSFWNWKFCGLLLLSTLVDFHCGKSIAASLTDRIRKRYLLLSILTNLGILGFFKYFNFFTDSFVELFGVLGWQANPVTLNILLPVGISFYTFQTMSYTIEVFRKQIPACTNIWQFALYVSFFPQLVAGPIERAGNLLPQLQNLGRKLDGLMVRQGAVLVLAGYIKKVLLSDQISPYVDQTFANWTTLSSLELWEGLFLFSLQIYFDFSGYTDIARGVSKWFGVDLMVNFRQPYFSTNIADFWHRWHISLSNWLKEYLYIPLGGNRKGRARTYLNLMITMLLGGLWHGASLTFVFWGLLHGLYLAIHKAMRSVFPVPAENSWNRPLKIVCTHLLVVLTWLPFRSPDFATTWGYLTKLFTFQGTLDWSVLSFIGLLYAVLFLVDFPLYKTKDEYIVLRLPRFFRLTYYTVSSIAIVFLLLSVREARPFIYFQF